MLLIQYVILQVVTNIQYTVVYMKYSNHYTFEVVSSNAKAHWNYSTKQRIDDHSRTQTCVLSRLIMIGNLRPGGSICALFLLGLWWSSVVWLGGGSKENVVWWRNQ